jgi:hypothetical protein
MGSKSSFSFGIGCEVSCRERVGAGRVIEKILQGGEAGMKHRIMCRGQ